MGYLIRDYGKLQAGMSLDIKKNLKRSLKQRGNPSFDAKIEKVRSLKIKKKSEKSEKSEAFSSLTGNPNCHENALAKGYWSV